MADDRLPFFHHDAARVGEIDLVVQADVVQVVFIPVFAQKCVHLCNGFRFIVERAKVHDLHAEPLVDGQKFRFRTVELFLLCRRLDRPVEVRFRDEIRQAQDRDPAKIRFSAVVDRLRVRHLPEALERHDIVEKAVDLVSRALAHLERVGHGV